VDPAPYARVVPGAVKTDSATVIPALIDTRMDFSRIVLFPPTAGDPGAAEEDARAQPVARHADGWQPGRMTVTLDPAPPQPSYLFDRRELVSDWEARSTVSPHRCCEVTTACLTVALPAGAKVVELAFARSPTSWADADHGRLSPRSSSRCSRP